MIKQPAPNAHLIDVNNNQTHIIPIKNDLICADCGNCFYARQNQSRDNYYWQSLAINVIYRWRGEK